MAINFSDSILKNRLLAVFYFYLFAAKSGDFVELTVFVEHFEELGISEQSGVLSNNLIHNS